MLKRSFCLLVLLLCLGRLAAAESHAQEITIQKALDYLGSGRTEKGDLYLPARDGGGKPHPAVLIIHGGGWTGGKRDAAREINIGTTLAQHGYVALSIDYLLSHSNHAVWPTNLWDCKTAVRWLRSNAQTLNIDPAHIGVIGGSAGGHLSAMVALTGNDPKLNPSGPCAGQSCAVSCGVDMYGITDFPTYHPTHPMLGSSANENPNLYREASPLTHVRSNSPPILILHGDQDKTVALQQSELLDQSLTKAGVEHRLVIIPGAVHSFHLQPPQRDLRPLVLEFFDKHLKP